VEHADHILIVDDDREIRELDGNHMQKDGLRTTVLADGRQMRNFLESTTVDLMDIMTPGDDGVLLRRELRTGKHKATPILMLTARNDEGRGLWLIDQPLNQQKLQCQLSALNNPRPEQHFNSLPLLPAEHNPEEKC